MADCNRFSVVIPLYNKRRHIVRSIQSVLNQNLQSFELLVVDDGSTDGSDVEVGNIRDKRVSLIRQSNAGVSAARNTGIANASNPYIAFLDADDEWFPVFLEQIDGLIRGFPNAIAFATNYYKSNPDHGRTLAQPGNETDTNNTCLLRDFFQRVAAGSIPINSSAICIPQRTFEKLGGFPEHIKLYEDLYMWTRLVLNGNVAYSSTPSAVYHRDADERACNYIIPKTSDLEFGNLISNAIESGRLDTMQSHHASVFVAKYGLLNAFKALVGGHPDEARSILHSLTLVTRRHQLRRSAIYILSLLPASWVQRIWKIGKSSKRAIRQFNGVTL